MRIVIDLQGAQAENRQRGIGHYALSLALALAKGRGEHEILLALNGIFPDTVEPLRAAFDGLLPRENIKVWESPARVSARLPASAPRREAAELVRETFLASLQADFILTPSLFEGLADDAASSVKKRSDLPSAVVLHDLIPLIHRDLYLDKDPEYAAWYMEKIAHLRRADLLLANSAASGQAAIDHLGFAPERVVNISGACGAHFQPLRVTEAHRRQLRANHCIERPFVMYTGGIDPRKNVDGLIRAYAALPEDLRRAHQLVLVCSIEEDERQRLARLALGHGLSRDDFIMTGFVPNDDLVLLYNAARLFVFPSWHEGLGLPVLEAMRCGRAVIAGNNSSLPEVAGRDDMLFDARDDASITAKMTQALRDKDFREELERHGLSQAEKFSWEESARRAIGAMVSWHAEHAAQTKLRPAKRPRLAYLSPLPPEASGIGDYSAELLPELGCLYDIDVIVAQKEVSDAWVRKNCPVRTVKWFRANAGAFDRVLYHFGNSPFHRHMFDLLEEIPGIVVLHDFFLSGIQAHREIYGAASHAWTQALYESHGYRAVAERHAAGDAMDVILRYPANLPILQNATGIIVHSEHARELARHWYGEEYGETAGRSWTVLPHLRAPRDGMRREEARRALGFAPEDFLLCSFGELGPAKLNHRLLQAWLASPLARERRAILVFVGKNHESDYGRQIEQTIRDSAGRIRITGRVDADVFRQYLAAADVGVQLRTQSRGETSGTVLDCMCHGLPTIVNAHGSMAELDPSSVWMLPDDFGGDELTEAIVTLWRDPARRQALGEEARKRIESRHSPRHCAERYGEAIERYHAAADAGLPGLLSRLGGVPAGMDMSSLCTLLARNFPPAPRQRQLLVDISELVQRDSKTGIQRVVRSVLGEWLANPAGGAWRVEPVYATATEEGYRYARRFTCRFLGMPDTWAEDAPVDAWEGDVFLGLDLQSEIVPPQAGFLEKWHNHGVRICFVVHDLLPVLFPNFFGAGAFDTHQAWLETISRFDTAICVSRSVADDLRRWWLTSAETKPKRLPRIEWFHLGADIAASAPSRGLPADAQNVLDAIGQSASFLMVGTLEPRKGHAEVLDAFERLWERGVDVTLTIVGKEGWMVSDLMNRLRAHPEKGKRLFWLDGISDEYLERVYAASACLIAASHGEGFGLPVIEAAQHGLPVIARDIPVFREVAGEYARFFSADLAETITQWLADHQPGERKHQKPEHAFWQSWQESARRLWNLATSHETR